MMARSAESVASPTKTRKKFKNQETSPGVGDSKNLGFLRTFVTQLWAADSVLAVSMGEKASGEQFYENLHAEHLNEVLNHEWLSASVINVYAR
jgi:hypothetical protein